MNKIDQEQLIFFEFLSTLSQEQLVRYFSMLGGEEQDYVRSVVQNIGTQLNMEIAEHFDAVEDLSVAKHVLDGFTLSGKSK